MRRRHPLLILLVCLSLAAPVWAQGGAGQQASDGQSTIHVVQRGENLYRIALQYGTSVEAITQSNGLNDPTSIQTGQRLIIPSGIVNATVPTANRHIVQPGETLTHIALRYGSTPDLIAALNNIVNPERLIVGQALDVSETVAGRAPVTRGFTHTLQPGETLYRVALRYGVTLRALQTANQIAAPTLIYPGQRLIIPSDTSNAPTLQDLPASLSSLVMTPLPAEVGRSFSVRVAAREPVTLSGTFLDRSLRFANDDSSYYALYGVQAFTEPGIYPLTITVQDAAGGTATLTAQVRVADGGYSSETITVPDAQASLLDPTLNESEYTQVAAYMTGFTPTRSFDGPMGLPASAPVTSAFGTRRSYNGGVLTSFHTGADFGSAPGAAITAPAAGTVVFSQQVAIRGLLTIIDHGWGVYTAYFHQSDTIVTAGQFVNTGDMIGRVGNTGRSVGPHLHWEMWVNGVEVDPLQWARFSFP